MRPSVQVRLEAISDGVVAVAESTYVLAELDFDFEAAQAGPSSGDLCGCANQILEVVFTRASYLDGTGVEHPVNLEEWCHPWNDAVYSLTCSPDDCPNYPNCGPSPPTSCTVPTPATRTTWGTIKNQYRMQSR